MPFLNNTGMIGTALVYMTTNVTGNEALTYLMLTVGLMALCMLFKMPLELTFPIIFPFLMVLGLYAESLFSIIGVAILYIAVLIAKKWVAN